MALSQAAYKAEQAIGHDDNSITAQDVSNPAKKEEWGDKSETMKALAWYGKNDVRIGMLLALMNLTQPNALHSRST